MSFLNNKQFTHIIIIGGQRCGTTYLLNLLKTSKQFLLTNKIFPEPKYFLQKNPSYIDYLKNHFKITKNEDERILVEKSTTYYEKYYATYYTNYHTKYDPNIIPHIKPNILHIVQLFQCFYFLWF